MYYSDLRVIVSFTLGITTNLPYNSRPEELQLILYSAVSSEDVVSLELVSVPSTTSVDGSGSSFEALTKKRDHRVHVPYGDSFVFKEVSGGIVAETFLMKISSFHGGILMIVRKI
ncbi:hypothetical protein OIU74_019046 [Salix koriyanagi]|uniref:Uncharacterized protein n=1 Tax=Salix koriyanagi TaxID=2511006 RepID=A0A9Q1AJ50_9ROSI|nr:hypothetical protein OIU74_019046 [Salix koriyanagi]